MSGYCIRCGKLLPDGAVFCPGCGNKIEVVSEGEALPAQNNCPRGAMGTEGGTSQSVARAASAPEGKRFQGKVLAWLAAAALVIIAVVAVGVLASTGLFPPSGERKYEESPNSSGATTQISSRDEVETPAETSGESARQIASNSQSSETHPDDAGILSNATARNSYNLFLSNFTETGMGNIENAATADATELVRFAISHDGINSPSNWEGVAVAGNKTHRMSVSRIGDLTWRYMGARVNCGNLSSGNAFTCNGDYVYFNRSDVATAPQGVASVTGSERIGSKMFKVYFSVYSGSYDATDQTLYSCSEEELNQRFGSRGPAYKGVATIMAGGNDEYTDGLTLVSYKRL